jgi:hypothetical protein
MIGFNDDINCTYSECFSNFNFIDTYDAFKEASDKITFIIPEFIKYISGNRTKSKVYGQIRNYYTDELIYMNSEILNANVQNMKNVDTIIEDSCSIYKDLRVVILKDNVSVSNIAGYEIVSFMSKDTYINTIFIEDIKMDTRLAFDICIALFDKIITRCLYENNVPVICSKYISLYRGDINLFKVSKFIFDYFYELLRPFVEKITIEDKELSDIVYKLSKYNFNILSEEELEELYRVVDKIYKGYADYFDYLELVVKYQDKLEKAMTPFNVQGTN